MKVYDNPGAVIMAKILALEKSNRDELLREEYKVRNRALIKMYREKLEEYEMRN